MRSVPVKHHGSWSLEEPFCTAATPQVEEDMEDNIEVVDTADEDEDADAITLAKMRKMGMTECQTMKMI